MSDNQPSREIKIILTGEALMQYERMERFYESGDHMMTKYALSLLARHQEALEQGGHLAQILPGKQPERIFLEGQERG